MPRAGLPLVAGALVVEAEDSWPQGAPASSEGPGTSSSSDALAPPTLRPGDTTVRPPDPPWVLPPASSRDGVVPCPALRGTPPGPSSLLLSPNPALLHTT